MPRFAANLTMLFTELPFFDRFEPAAKAASMPWSPFPYAFAAEEIKARLDANGPELVLRNLPARQWDAGKHNITACPTGWRIRQGVARRSAMRRRSDTAARVPRRQGAGGRRRRGAAPTFATLELAAAELKRAGLRLVMEPINPYDIPGFYLQRTEQALAILDEVGSDNLFIQYDIYHAQRTEGELAATLQKHLAKIDHVQLADNPGRNEPGSGEINYDFLFAHLDRIGYGGWVGCEYKPKASTEAGLGWLQAARAKAA